MADYSGAYTYFRAAVDGMAVSPKNLQHRVGGAWNHLIPILGRVEDFPPELQADYQQLLERMDQVQDSDQGSALASAQKLTDAEAEEAAHQLVHMLDILTAHSYDEE